MNNDRNAFTAISMYDKKGTYVPAKDDANKFSIQPKTGTRAVTTGGTNRDMASVMRTSRRRE